MLLSKKLSAMLIGDREDPRGRLPSVNLDCQYQPYTTVRSYERIGGSIIKGAKS
jgi:hypothetical protein